MIGAVLVFAVTRVSLGTVLHRLHDDGIIENNWLSWCRCFVIGREFKNVLMTMNGGQSKHICQGFSDVGSGAVSLSLCNRMPNSR